MRQRITRHWPLVVPVALSSVLSSWALVTVGWGNTYYAAAVRGMSTSWHAFLFGSLDAGGFVTVDKPPFSMWVQALVVKVFGYHQLSLLVPQVLAGVLAVVLVYLTVVRRWGRMAATIGATALAISPISVMVNHSNNTDAILTLMMTACAYAGVRGVETSRVRWGIASAVFFGAAFTTKMLAAAPVLPSVLIAFALGSTLTWKRRTLFAGAGAAIAVVSALAWFSFVDLTPASDRPYIGSSSTNSAFQLAFERNGVNQVEGDSSVMGGPSGPSGSTAGNGRPGRPPGGFEPGEVPSFTPGEMPDFAPGELPDIMPGGMPGASGGNLPGGPTIGRAGGRGGMSGFDGGKSGVLRLFNDSLGTQIGWLIVPGLAGLLGALALLRRRRPWREPTLVIPAVWFAGGALAYSITKGIVHPYYVASIVPPLAILIGVGSGAARCSARRLRTLLAVGCSIAASGTVSWVIARRTHHALTTSTALSATIVGLLVMVGAVILRARNASYRPHAALVVGALGLALLSPFVWTAAALKAGISANLPYADATAVNIGVPQGGGRGDASIDTATLTYLEAHRGSSTWLVAVPSAMMAAPIIIATGEPVMALGGFSGNDPILQVDDFDALVAVGAVRYVLTEGVGGVPGGANSTVLAHVTKRCTIVTDAGSSQSILYDCAGLA